MQQRPKDIQQLQQFVMPEIVDRWEDIAIQLHGFDPKQLKRIEQNHQDCPVENSCRSMLWEWLDNFSRNTNLEIKLIQAIKDVEYVYYAELFERDMKSGTDIINDPYMNKTVIPRIAVKWYDVGIRLGVPDFKLDNIKKEKDHISQQCLEMLQLWLQRGSNVPESHHPTWKNMHKAMLAVELIASAERLAKKLKDTLNVTV